MILQFALSGSLSRVQYQIWYHILVLLPVPNNMLNMFGQYRMWYHRLAMGFQGGILFMAAPLVFRVKFWHNPSGTSSDCQGDSLEQSYLGVGNPKTIRTPHQQFIFIYCLMFRLHTVVQEREKICKGLWRDTKRHALPPPDWNRGTQTSNWQPTD